MGAEPSLAPTFSAASLSWVCGGPWTEPMVDTLSRHFCWEQLVICLFGSLGQWKAKLRLSPIVLRGGDESLRGTTWYNPICKLWFIMQDYSETCSCRPEHRPVAEQILKGARPWVQSLACPTSAGRDRILPSAHRSMNTQQHTTVIQQAQQKEVKSLKPNLKFHF